MIRVLLSNDDGFHSTGIRCLYDALSAHFAVTTVAPQREQSGVSHAFTFHSPLYYEKVGENGSMPGYVVNGTPSDCVKFAVSTLMSQRPDVVVSGMNLGENSGISGFYSGTLAAAREGAFWGIPSVAFSVCDGAKSHMADYSAMAVRILRHILEMHTSSATYYNVNFPACPVAECRGIKVARQSMAFFDDRYRSVVNERGEEGFLVYGQKIGLEQTDDYDSCALANNYATVSPLHFDATAEEALRGLQSQEHVFQS
jgi:5'-nucleotidase